MEEITGYFVDLPQGANSIAVNGGEDTPLGEYTGGIYTPETENLYGLVEWSNETSIYDVVVNGNETLSVQYLIGGLHPTQRPK